jgi:hypothetical protein
MIQTTRSIRSIKVELLELHTKSCLSMMFRHCMKIALIWLSAVVAIAGSPGCAMLGRHHAKCQPVALGSAPVQPKVSLPVIQFESRQLIELSELTNPIEGMPIAINPSIKPEAASIPPPTLRDLTYQEMTRLAGEYAPLARRLEAYRDWLCTLKRPQTAIINALTQQARFERSRHQLASQEAYLNLVNVHVKTPILNRTRLVLMESEEALNKLRDAGIDIPGDPQDLARRRLEVAENLVEVHFNQQRLNAGLESLLNLAPSDEVPIWTNFQASTKPQIPDAATAIETAYCQRGDLLALVALSEGSHSLSPESLRGVEPSNPLIGAGIDIPGPAKIWQCLLKNEIEWLKKSAQAERKRQLETMIATKCEQIQLEVRQSLATVERHDSTLKIKLARVENLRQSMAAAERAVDLRPIDFTMRLQQRTDELRLISEVIDELIALEIEYARLQHTMGY